MRFLHNFFTNVLLTPAFSRVSTVLLCIETANTKENDAVCIHTSLKRIPLKPLLCCAQPIAAMARMVDGQLHFRGLVASPDGKRVLETEATCPWDKQIAIELGFAQGAKLKAQGGPSFFQW